MDVRKMGPERQLERWDGETFVEECGRTELRMQRYDHQSAWFASHEPDMFILTTHHSSHSTLASSVETWDVSHGAASELFHS